MNFGTNEYDNGMSISMRSPPASTRRPSQALALRNQQSPMHNSSLQLHQPQSTNGGPRTPNSRYNTPSKGLPKASYLQQRRTPGGSGSTPLMGDRHTPSRGSPYINNSPHTNTSRMSMSMAASPSPGGGGLGGMATPGRRGSGRRWGSGLEPHQQQSFQHEYSRMDETLNGGDIFDKSNIDQNDDNTSQYSGNGNGQMIIRSDYSGASGGLRQRRHQSTPGGMVSNSGGGAMIDSQSVTKSLHPHWVIIFGLPSHVPEDSPCSTTNVLKMFQAHGEIDNYHTSPGNWLLIKFSSSLDANNAAGVLHRTFLTSEVMIGVETLTPELAKKLNLTFQVDGKLVVTPGKNKKFNRVEQQGKAHGALLDPDYDNIMRPPRKVTKDICTRIYEFFMF